MAIVLPWRSLLDKFPAAEVRTAETLDKDENFDGLPVRGFLWTLFFFKIATVLVIFWAASGTSEAGILLSATTWPWLIIPGIVVFGWLAFHFRMRRVRARRQMLMRSEWMLDEHETMAAFLGRGRAGGNRRLKYVAVRWVRPAMVAITAALITGILIFSIGHLLLHFHDAATAKEYQRRELWAGLILTVGILAVASFLASRPQGSLGRLDKQVAIGKAPMKGELNLAAVPMSAKYGPEGSISDLTNGYTLYARNGALAETIEVLKSVEDVGGMQRTLIYAKGLYGAQNELWIPIEAVSSVYPDTRSAFLAIAGDEAETFGWNRPPVSFSRTERPKETPLY